MEQEENQLLAISVLLLTNAHNVIFMRLKKLLDTKIHAFFEHNSLLINMAGTKLILSSQHCPKKNAGVGHMMVSNN